MNNTSQKLRAELNDLARLHITSTIARTTAVLWVGEVESGAPFLLELMPELDDIDPKDVTRPFEFGPSLTFRRPVAISVGSMRVVEGAMRSDADFACRVASGVTLTQDGTSGDDVLALAKELSEQKERVGPN
jgi:hypothetical protein